MQYTVFCNFYIAEVTADSHNVDAGGALHLYKGADLYYPVASFANGIWLIVIQGNAGVVTKG